MNRLDYLVKKYGINLKKGPVIEVTQVIRDDFPLLFKELGYKVGAEIGCFKGEYTEKFAPHFEKIYTIDPWTSYYDFKEQAELDRYYEEAKARLAPYPNVSIIHATSMEAVNQFENNSLDFVYIDGNHELKWVVEDIFAWEKKVKIGGMISGHDYIKFRKQNYSHIVEAVSAFTTAYNIPTFFVTARRDTPGNKHRNNQRSWFWVKEKNV